MKASAFIFSNSWTLFFPHSYSSFFLTTARGNLVFSWIGSVTHTHTWDVNFITKNAYKAA